jgi:hypothetical protein
MDFPVLYEGTSSFDIEYITTVAELNSFLFN